MSVGCFLYMLLLAFSFPQNCHNILVLATYTLPSLQQHPTSLCHEHDKSALLRFKRSFLIDCDASFSAFAYPKLKSWDASDDGVTNGDCCRWDGVECDKNTGRVIRLDLSGSCLYGTFPTNSSLFELNDLLELNLAHNNFNYSQIPSAIGNLYKLNYLNLTESAFSGKIPSEISKLSTLSLLDLSYNGNPFGIDPKLDLKLHDLSLEKLVTNLTRLTQLVLDQVDISSTIPLILSNRTSLKVISLPFCHLFGKSPASLFSLPNLEELLLYFNSNLEGYLPEFHSNSPLHRLFLSGTGFSGVLPATLGNLGSLSDLELDTCYFSGKIPSSLGNLTKLTSFTLEENFLSGSFPASFTNLTRVVVLSLSDVKNPEPGIWTSWLPKLNSLTQLALHRMNFGSEILHPLSNLTRLKFLDLAENQITSLVPSWLMNLTQLNTLDLSLNKLQGPIPPWISQLNKLQWLSLSFKNSVGMFDSFLKLPSLGVLYLSGVSLTFPSNISINSTSLLKFNMLDLISCNLREFPEFLRHQEMLRGLSLSGNNIRSDIPTWFVNITSESLLSLDLSNNLLTGFEQTPMKYLPWINLENLNLNGNKFQGTLLYPPNSLQIYQVSGNNFSGVVSKHICRGTSLIYLDLSNNSLSGKIPKCMVHQLSVTLQVLNLRGNSFSGTIPQNFSASCKLKMISLSQNQFEGKLPISMGGCKMLEVLDVGKNRIQDNFPAWLGCLPKLQVLVLRHNYFHGSLIAPLRGNDFQSLRIIDLSYNYFTGNLPLRYIKSWLAMAVSTEDSSNSSNSFFRISDVSIVDTIGTRNFQYDYGITITNKGSETYYSRILTVFRVIDFSSNKFTGRIPETIGNLRGLQALNLSNNNLAGDIPGTMANITDLEALDLSQNMLSGEIPQDLTILTSLEVFNVSYNQLVGPIPQENQFSTFDASSFGGNLALCGAQLSIKCKNTYSLPPSSSLEETSHDYVMIDWIIRSLGCASGLIIGCIIGKVYVTDRHHDWFVETFGRRDKLKTRVRRSEQKHMTRSG